MLVFTVLVGLAFSSAAIAASVPLLDELRDRQRAQNAADAAALAGASQLFDRQQLSGTTYQNTTTIYNTAQKFATANKGGGVALTLGSGDVEYGYGSPEFALTRR